MSTTEIIARLQSIDIFKEVPIDQLEWFAKEGEILDPPLDTFIWNTDEPVVRTYILLEGEIKIIRQSNGESMELFIVESGGVTGYLPYSRIKNAMGGGLVSKPSTIFIFPKEKTKSLIANHFELTQALVSVMTTRVKENMERQKQNEKMMALGKLSAGLAHELNNPIAAIIRNSEALQKHLKLVPEAFKDVMNIKITPDKVDAANEILFRKLSENVKRKLTPLERADLEDEIVDWLDKYDIKNPYEIAENLVEYNFGVDDLDEFKKHIPDKDFDPVINWINNNLITEKTVEEIREASTRIGALVQSIKTYTHMDRDKEKQEVDIHDGIRSTLTILSYKLKKDNVKVVETFSPTLPRACIMVGEMNQVWTNLIDNAIDGMDTTENKVLEIQSRLENGLIKVNIIDNGKGIPAAIKDRIFEPFFTTKEMGKGTGLGLDLVMSIMRQHKGSVKVESEAGCTNFEIAFPLKS